jgi:hypothetical protein
MIRISGIKSAFWARTPTTTGVGHDVGKFPWVMMLENSTIIVGILLAWIAKSKPCPLDLAILRSHIGNCWGLNETSRRFRAHVQIT